MPDSQQIDLFGQPIDLWTDRQGTRCLPVRPVIQACFSHYCKLANKSEKLLKFSGGGRFHKESYLNSMVYRLSPDAKGGASFATDKIRHWGPKRRIFNCYVVIDAVDELLDVVFDELEGTYGEIPELAEGVAIEI